MGTLTKALIGKEDFDVQINTNAPEQFSRLNSVGSTIDLYKVPDIWTYTGAIRPGDIVTKGPWVDVRAYGAVGDGVADDAAAIQLAITAAQNGIVFIPDGTWIIGTQLIIYSYTTLVGIGQGVSILKQKGTSNLAAMLVNSDQSSGNSNITIKGITFDGNKAAQTGGTGKGIFFREVTDLLVEDFEIKNCYGSAANAYGFHGENIIRGIWSKFKMSGNNGGGIAVHGDYITIQNFYIDQTGSLESDGISCGTGAYASINSTHVLIQEGTALNSHVINVQMAADYGTIRKVKSSGSGQGHSTGAGIDIARSNHVLVEDCDLYNNCGGIVSESQVPDDATMQQGDYKILHNLIRSCASGYPIYLETSGVGGGTIEGIEISGNTIINNTGGGIKIIGTVNDLVITDNIIKDNAEGIGIGNTTRGLIEGNIISGSTGANIALYTGCSKIKVGQNQLSESTARAVWEEAANLAIPLMEIDNATPSAEGANIWRTANTGPTTITRFDDVYIGQQFVVYFGDAVTTLDFSGNNYLKGNGGADWTPAAGDFMRVFVIWDVANAIHVCVCSCHDAT